ncbi:MAG: acyl-CoA thioesterase, partial [Bacteroidetes bacterium]|nr:acyl-CoA thioesterase [Bacteroidota bacterium]
MALTEKIEIPVRFSEVDSMRIVWHGHYLLYFEEGREAFGRKYGISYLDIFANKLMTPLVKISCEYKRPLEYGDIAVVETRFIDSPAAKICFEYT